MNEQELRDGLANVLREQFCQTVYQKVDAIIAYIRQHDGHAEFVRAVLTEASREVGPNDRDYRLDNIVETCDAELAREN